MLDFGSIGLFVLGTTTLNGRFDQSYPNYFQSRIIPIQETWGSYFPHLYFVFGRNAFDHKFLHQRCNIPNEHNAKISHGRRRLAPRARQVPPKNISQLFECPVKESEHVLNSTFSNISTSMINILYTGNCTGEYFGLGPTCRCQESMRYFFNNPKRFSTIEYFVFMDDDIYYRPFSLLSFLQEVSINNIHNNNSLTFISSMLPMAKHLRSKLTYQLLPRACVTLLETSFYYAQPAIMNRAAMQKLRVAILEQNSMTVMQQYWGGSHDLILGLLLWIHEIPLFSMQSFYYGAIILKPVSTAKQKFLTPDLKQSNPTVASHVQSLRKQLKEKYFIAHRVMNLIVYHEKLKKKNVNSSAVSFANGTIIQNNPLPKIKYVIANQYDLAVYFEDMLLYNQNEKNQTAAASINSLQDSSQQQVINQVIQEQQRIGKEAYQTLVKLPESTVQQTEYFHTVTRRFRDYQVFLPHHCLRRNETA